MNKKEIEYQLQCFDIIEIDYRAHISAQKFFLRQICQKALGVSESHFDEMYSDLYIQNWKEYYESIPLFQRDDMLIEFYNKIFS